MKRPAPAPLSELIDNHAISDLRDLILVAQGKQEATLLLKNCRLVNVHSGEIYRTDISIHNNRIASITAGAVTRASEVIDCTDFYAIPGLIEPHTHVDTTLLWPSELARVLVPLGTTTLFVDTVNIAHTGGTPAVQGLIKAFDGLPLRAFFSAPSYTPLEPDLETAAARITAVDIAEMLQWEGVVSIGETVSSKILGLESDFLARLALCHTLDKIISGHGGDLPRGDEHALDAYVASGIGDDHCVNRNEDIPLRLRRGVTMFLVEAPGREQIRGLFEHILTQHLPTQKMCLCIDNITVTDIVARGNGYLDKPLRIGLQSGLPVVDVIRMATLNPAVHYRKDNQIGSLAPGRLADLVLLRELDLFPPEMVIVDGKIVARQGKLVAELKPTVIPPIYLNSIHLPADFSPERLEVHTEPGNPDVRARVIQVVDGDAVNQCIVTVLKHEQGIVRPDIDRDILKIAIIERYGQSGSLTNAFVQGFRLQRGAIATSYSVPSNNIVVVGTNEKDMFLAVEQLVRMQGGHVVVDDGQVLAEVRLPIGGIMTAEPHQDLVQAIAKANAATRSLGCQLQHPFFTMSQTVLSTLPELGLTDRGLVDVRRGQIVDVLVED
jgi:adenine deaminase